MFSQIIESINTLQESRLHEVSLIENRLSYPDGPNTKEDGLYWIYTSHTNNDLLNSTPSLKRSSINYSIMVDTYQGINHICSRSVDGYYLVYNGIGGVGPKGYGGLRERILEDYRGGDGTGSLAIKGSSLNTLSNWRVSYVLWSEIPFNSPCNYTDLATTLERLWRIHYGWPILCKK